MPDLLLELFSEEIPARMQARAAADLRKLVTNGLVEAGVTYEGVAAFSTPRRLTLSVNGLVARTRPRREERKGPRADAPQKAIEGFLRATGLSLDQLELRDDKKGQVYFAVIEKPGRPAAEVIAELIPSVVRGFPWPKSMRWGEGALRWVRPLHSVLCILSSETEETQIVPFEIDGLISGDTTRGHRAAASGALRVRDFEDYARKLEAARVILDAEERARRIWADAQTLAFAQGMELVEDAALLAEVAGLVEWPVVLIGDIGAEFLDLPPEVLRTSMKEHQKFFSVKNPDAGRIEKFIIVANIEARDGGAAILIGNQRVLAARLSDAKFFWENDLRIVAGKGLEGLRAMAAPLEKTAFHYKLGTQTERVERIAVLAGKIARIIGANPDQVECAAQVCKADLASQMVHEFPELQGLMGRYYAQKAGLPDAVAAACEEHYSPLGPSDQTPSAPVSVAVALADKIDMLAGFWAINERPTGSKDPFALRRAGLGVIRLVLENRLRIGLIGVISRHFVEHDYEVELTDEESAMPAGAKKNQIIENRLAGSLLSFLHDRLKVHLRARGVRHDVIDACLTRDAAHDDLTLLVERIDALQALAGSGNGANLLAGYRRAANILDAEQGKDGVAYTLDPDLKFAEQDEEKALFHALDAAGAQVTPALDSGDFAAAMAALAELRAPIDAFFDKVTVNADNPIIRRNRLCLLNRIRAVMERVAAFSALEG